MSRLVSIICTLCLCLSITHSFAQEAQLLGKSSLDSPTLIEFRSKLYMMWVGYDKNNLYLANTTNGESWSSGSELSKTTTEGPVIIEHKGNLWASWKGEGNNSIYVTSSEDGKKWDKSDELKKTTEHAPDLASHQGKLFIAWKGEGDNHIYLAHSGDMKKWSDSQKLDKTTYHSPNLIHFNGILVLAWRDREGSLKIATSEDGTYWGGVQEIAQGAKGKASMIQSGDQLFIAWQGQEDNSLYLSQTEDTNTWSEAMGLGISSSAAPVLGDFRGSLYMAFKEQDGAELMMVKLDKSMFGN